MSFATKESFRSFLLQHLEDEQIVEVMVEEAFPVSQILFVIHFPPQIERAIAGEHLYLE